MATRARVWALRVGAVLLYAAVVLAPSGRWDWGDGWAFLGLLYLAAAVNLACLRRWNPQLIERRAGWGEGTKAWDKAFCVLVTPLMAAVFAVPGLDAGRHGPSLGATSQPVGLVLFLVGWGWITWAMVINPHFERTVRLQWDRQHQVVAEGPYAWVRHPGYLGYILFCLSTPLLLRSAWGLLPAALTAAAFTLRTAAEDRTLRAELPGYRAYSTRVRARLVPGVW